MFSCNWGFSGCSFLLCAGSLLGATGEGSISLGSGLFPITWGSGLLWAQVLWENLAFQCWLSLKHGNQGVYSGVLVCVCLYVCRGTICYLNIAKTLSSLAVQLFHSCVKAWAKILDSGRGDDFPVWPLSFFLIFHECYCLSLALQPHRQDAAGY